jgi:glucan phosphoethanolaminetransferase (alkaline phosphatase superfamily)
MRFILFLFFNRQQHVFGDLIPSFLLGLRFDVRMVCVLMLLMLVLGSIHPLNPFHSKAARTGWNIFFGILVFGLVLFYFIDFAHYAYLTQRLNASVLNYLEDAGISMSMVWQSYPVIKLLFALLLISLLILWIRKIIFRRMESSQSVKTIGKRIAWFAILFILFGLGIFGRINQYPLRWSDAFQLGDDYKAQLALNPFESFLNTLKYRHSGYDIKKVRQYYPLLAAYYNFPVAGPDSLQFKRYIKPKDTLASKPNVVLVICESFSAYKSSAFGNGLNTTPFFDQLCKKGIFFNRCFTPTYGTARTLLLWISTASLMISMGMKNFISLVEVHPGLISGDY